MENSESQKKKFAEDIDGFLEGFFEHSFNNQPGLRCIYPKHMHKKLRKTIDKKYREWFSKLAPEKRNSDDIIPVAVEKLKKLIRSTATKLAESEEDEITLKYPMLPRVGDKFHAPELDPNHEHMNEVVERYAVKKGKKWVSIKIKYKHPDIDGETETEFEIVYD